MISQRMVSFKFDNTLKHTLNKPWYLLERQELFSPYALSGYARGTLPKGIALPLKNCLSMLVVAGSVTPELFILQLFMAHSRLWPLRAWVRVRVRGMGL